MIRQPRDSDQAFVASTWVRSMVSTHAHKAVPHHQRRHGLDRSMGAPIGRQVNAYVDRLMDLPGSRCLITAWDENDDVILGWIAFGVNQPCPTVHYLWVRQMERGKGIARAMLEVIGVEPGVPVICTSHGPSSDAMRSAYRGSRYVPIEEFLK